MTELKKAFKDFDKNSDGYISKDELETVMITCGYTITKAEVEEMIKIVDTDGNGLIDFDEFIKLMDTWSFSTTDEISERETLKLFQQIDLNKDGFINSKELKQMLKDLGEKAKKKDVRKMMKEADLNKDGKISYAEFKTLMKNMSQVQPNSK